MSRPSDLVRAFTWHDDQNAPCVAVINREFARKILGSETGASASITSCGAGSGYKCGDCGRR